MEGIGKMYLKFREVLLERPQRLKATVHVTDESLAVDFYPYAVEPATQQMLGRCGTEITLRGAALYNYARFEGDCDLESAKILYAARIESYPVAFRDYVLLALYRWIKKFVYWVSKKPFYLHQFPLRLCPRRKYFEVLEWDEKRVRVERIQEALFAQMYMLKKLGLEPQAILASPDIVNDLVAHQTKYDREVVYRGGLMFASLPVVVCPELIQGAIVV